MKYMKDVGGGSRKRGRCDEDPMSTVANLFDVAMVFALGLMVMLLMYLSILEVLTQTDMTIVKNPAAEYGSDSEKRRTNREAGYDERDGPNGNNR